VVVLTKDEEANLPACMASLTGFGDVHVLDSGSSDGTCEVALKLGATVHMNPFRGFGTQRNWAIDNIPVLHDWQLHLDADERMTSELGAEIAAVVATNPAVGGYLTPSKLIFCRRWLRHAGDYPTYQVRLFHRKRLRFIDHGHGQRETTKHGLGRLSEPYLHEAFSKGLDHWFAKHAVYARQEAEQAIGEAGIQGAGESLFSSDPTMRRRALKRLVSRLPGRYFFRLLHILLVKRAILDGAAGLVYAKMMATYESMIDVHLSMLRHGLAPVEPKA